MPRGVRKNPSLVGDLDEIGVKPIAPLVQTKAAEPPPARAKRQGKNMGPANIAKNTRRIMIEENGDIPPVGLYVGVNGYGYLIKPGVIIDAPKAVIEILDNAIVSVPTVDPFTLKITGSKDRMRFPYRNMDRIAA